jgi:hypothetical protein
LLSRELFFPAANRLLDARDGTIFLEIENLSRIGVLFGNCAGVKSLILAYVAEPRAIDENGAEIALLEE